MLTITIEEFEDFGHRCEKTDEVDPSGNAIYKCACGITGFLVMQGSISIPRGQDHTKVFKCPNAKIIPGLYRIIWMNLTTSLASIGYDQAGNAWYAPTNWVHVPGYDWSAVLAVQRIVENNKSITDS